MWLMKFINKILSLFKKKNIVVGPVKEPKKEEVPMRQFRIVIDPGHGGKDSGSSTEKSKEKELNLIYSNILYNLLEQDYHFIPMLTRTKDEYRSLKYRTDFAKQNNADIFISVHCNSFVSQGPNDAQVYYYSNEKDKPLAETLFNYVDKIDGRTSRWSRIMKANFFVLRNLINTSISAVLVEVGFLSNEEDEILLNDPEFQDKFCKGLCEGIKKFFNVGEK